MASEDVPTFHTQKLEQQIADTGTTSVASNRVPDTGQQLGNSHQTLETPGTVIMLPVADNAHLGDQWQPQLAQSAALDKGVLQLPAAAAAQFPTNQCNGIRRERAIHVFMIVYLLFTISLALNIAVCVTLIRDRTQLWSQQDVSIGEATGQVGNDLGVVLSVLLGVAFLGSQVVSLRSTRNSLFSFHTVVSFPLALWIQLRAAVQTQRDYRRFSNAIEACVTPALTFAVTTCAVQFIGLLSVAVSSRDSANVLWMAAMIVNAGSFVGAVSIFDWLGVRVRFYRDSNGSREPSNNHAVDSANNDATLGSRIGGHTAWVDVSDNNSNSMTVCGLLLWRGGVVVAHGLCVAAFLANYKLWTVLAALVHATVLGFRFMLDMKRHRSSLHVDGTDRVNHRVDKFRIFLLFCVGCILPLRVGPTGICDGFMDLICTFVLSASWFVLSAHELDNGGTHVWHEIVPVLLVFAFFALLGWLILTSAQHTARRCLSATRWKVEIDMHDMRASEYTGAGYGNSQSSRGDGWRNTNVSAIDGNVEDKDALPSSVPNNDTTDNNNNADTVHMVRPSVVLPVTDNTTTMVSHRSTHASEPLSNAVAPPVFQAIVPPVTETSVITAAPSAPSPTTTLRGLWDINPDDSDCVDVDFTGTVVDVAEVAQITLGWDVDDDNREATGGEYHNYKVAAVNDILSPPAPLTVNVGVVDGGFAAVPTPQQFELVTNQLPAPAPAVNGVISPPSLSLELISRGLSGVDQVDTISLERKPVADTIIGDMFRSNAAPSSSHTHHDQHKQLLASSVVDVVNVVTDVPVGVPGECQTMQPLQPLIITANTAPLATPSPPPPRPLSLPLTPHHAAPIPSPSSSSAPFARQLFPSDVAPLSRMSTRAVSNRPRGGGTVPSSESCTALSPAKAMYFAKSVTNSDLLIRMRAKLTTRPSHAAHIKRQLPPLPETRTLAEHGDDISVYSGSTDLSESLHSPLTDVKQVLHDGATIGHLPVDATVDGSSPMPKFQAYIDDNVPQAHSDHTTLTPSVESSLSSSPNMYVSPSRTMRADVNANAQSPGLTPPRADPPRASFSLGAVAASDYNNTPRPWSSAPASKGDTPAPFVDYFNYGTTDSVRRGVPLTATDAETLLRASQDYLSKVNAMMSLSPAPAPAPTPTSTMTNATTATQPTIPQSNYTRPAITAPAKRMLPIAAMGMPPLTSITTNMSFPPTNARSSSSSSSAVESLSSRFDSVGAGFSGGGGLDHHLVSDVKPLEPSPGTCMEM